MASFIYDVVKELGMGVAKFWLILRIVAGGFCRERERETERQRDRETERDRQGISDQNQMVVDVRGRGVRLKLLFIDCMSDRALWFVL